MDKFSEETIVEGKILDKYLEKLNSSEYPDGTIYTVHCGPASGNRRCCNDKDKILEVMIESEYNNWLDTIWKQVYGCCSKRNGSNITIEIATGPNSWLLYGGNGAKNFVSMGAEYSEGIHGVEGESIIKSEIPKILSQYKKIDLIDLGCGNGIAALPLIENIKNCKISYRPIDVSQHMLYLTQENIKKYARNVEYKLGIQARFQELNEYKEILSTEGAICLTLLGQTLGNHVRMNDQNGAIEVVKNISAVMKKGDKLLIGVGSIPNDVGKTVKNYNGQTVRRFVSTASKAIGIDTDSANYHVRYKTGEDGVGEVLLSLLISDWQEVTYPGRSRKLKDQSIKIIPGDEILTSNSSRLPLEVLEKICLVGGIEKVSHYMSPENYIVWLGEKNE